MTIRDDFSDCETDVRLEGKVAVVTGATSGAGLEVAKNLAQRGARVIICSRNQNKLELAREQIVTAAGHDNVVARQVDYESLSSVRAFVETTLTTEPRLDILVNNIGAVGLEDKLTADNLQLMMQVNYFGTFLMTFLLLPLLRKSAPSRVVNVSSLAVLLGDVNLDHLNDVGRYSNFGFYSNAKLAEVLFTVEMDKRVRRSGVNLYSMDPGLIKSVFFRNYNDGWLKFALNAALQKFGRPPHRVALMSVFLAVDPSVQGTAGMHYRDCHQFYSHWSANDTALTSALWNKSKQLVGITEEEDWEK